MQTARRAGTSIGKRFDYDITFRRNRLRYGNRRDPGIGRFGIAFNFQTTRNHACFKLIQCGQSKRDGDHDGIPCENLCRSRC